MQDTVRFHVVTINGNDYDVLDVSDELRDLLIKELQFGVNLPIDQEFQLTCLMTLHHDPN